LNPSEEKPPPGNSVGMRERGGEHLSLCTPPTTAVFSCGAVQRHVKSMSFPASRHHDNVIP